MKCIALSNWKPLNIENISLFGQFDYGQEEWSSESAVSFPELAGTIPKTAEMILNVAETILNVAEMVLLIAGVIFKVAETILKVAGVILKVAGRNLLIAGVFLNVEGAIFKVAETIPLICASNTNATDCIWTTCGFGMRIRAAKIYFYFADLNSIALTCRY